MHDRDSYVISDRVDPEERLFSADMVRLVCDLAYLPEKEGKEVDFDVEKYFEQKRKNEQAKKEAKLVTTLLKFS